MDFVRRLRARLDRTTEHAGLRNRAVASVSSRSARLTPADTRAESRLRDVLHEDPNDRDAFVELAEIVRSRAVEGHEGDDQRRAADDAVWALAEELAHSSKAWHPLVELARLSIHDDRDGALRRLGIAADRDPTGKGLAEGLAMLCEAGMPDDALGLGVGHWRPAEHEVEVGRHIVAAAVEAGRLAEARRHLEAMSHHPDKGRVAPLQAELDRYISDADRRRRASR